MVSARDVCLAGRRDRSVLSLLFHSQSDANFRGTIAHGLRVWSSRAFPRVGNGSRFGERVVGGMVWMGAVEFGARRMGYVLRF